MPVSGGSSRPKATPAAATAPSPAVQALAPGETIQHRVRSGDSLWKLASRYGTTTEQIRADNGLSSNNLQVGQLLTIRAGRERVGG